MLPEGTSVYPRSDLTPCTPQDATTSAFCRVGLFPVLMLPVAATRWIGFIEREKLRPRGSGGGGNTLKPEEDRWVRE